MSAHEVAPGVFRVEDTCQVYVIRAEGGSGIAIDFGSGLAMDHLEEMGISRITDVLMTHHHRDQGQGLPRAVAAGAAAHVPPIEQDLFAEVDEMWRTRPLINDYNLRQDRFSLLESVPVASTVPEYRTAVYGGVEVRVLPTPGHTTGSVTYLIERGGQRLAFTGDLLYAPGKVWSLAATQWSYTENEGPAMTVLSCYQLQRERPDLLLPSHGQPMPDPDHALGLLAERMQAYVDSRRPRPWDLRKRLDQPFEHVTEHLLLNTTSNSCSYVLLSESGAALVIDYGYDMTTGLPPGPDRAARRPWLASLPALKERHGVDRVEVALATHYHDDHVAGLNLLRDVEGTEVWTAETVAPILAEPMLTDLPCQWYEPIATDRVLGLGETVRWREYEITVHDLPGHTRFHTGFEFEVDDVRVLVTGDQQTGLGEVGGPREILNYQYRNRFRIEDYRTSAALYRRIAPGVMVSGHWRPRWVDEDYLDMLTRDGEELVRLHHELLPLDELDLGAEGVLARLEPYLTVMAPGQRRDFRVSLRNPFPETVPARLVPVALPGWAVSEELEIELPAAGEAEVTVQFTAPRTSVRRARLAIDVTFGALRLGQHCEAIVDVRP